MTSLGRFWPEFLVCSRILTSKHHGMVRPANRPEYQDERASGWPIPRSSLFASESWMSAMGMCCISRNAATRTEARGHDPWGTGRRIEYSCGDCMTRATTGSCCSTREGRSRHRRPRSASTPPSPHRRYGEAARASRNRALAAMWRVMGLDAGAGLCREPPQKVSELILRGIFTLRRWELEWFYQVRASRLFPDAWQNYIAPIRRRNGAT